MNSGFLKLATELCLEIYKYALVLPMPIEFWPDTGTGRQDFWQRCHDGKFYRRCFNRRNINLGLLRVSEQVNEEAYQVFYGQNEIRFSGINGCIIAAAFVYTIKARNTRWLTNVTIAMSLFTENRYIYANEGNPETHNRFWEVVGGSWPVFVTHRIVRSGLMTPPSTFSFSASARSCSSRSLPWYFRATSSWPFGLTPIL